MVVSLSNNLGLHLLLRWERLSPHTQTDAPHKLRDSMKLCSNAAPTFVGFGSSRWPQRFSSHIGRMVPRRPAIRKSNSHKDFALTTSLWRFGLLGIIF